MAKGTNDIILRDRLQFDIDATGDTALVYGRVDCSDYVSIPESKGLAIKEFGFNCEHQRLVLVLGLLTCFQTITIQTHAPI